MVSIKFNGESVPVSNLKELALSLDRFDQEPLFELWAETPNQTVGGPSMSMLRNGSSAWLMYLRFNGDAGYVSLGDVARPGNMSYRLGNGQVDKYPLSWCIDLEECYRAITYFFANVGARPDWIAWRESDGAHEDWDPRQVPVLRQCESDGHA
jgi:hypothetical protein